MTPGRSAEANALSYVDQFASGAAGGYSALSIAAGYPWSESGYRCGLVLPLGDSHRGWEEQIVGLTPVVYLTNRCGGDMSKRFATSEARDAFLQEPRLAILMYQGQRPSPTGIPVWFDWDAVYCNCLLGQR